MTRQRLQRHPFDQVLGVRLRAARTLAGISQDRLADQVQMSRQHIQKWEQGQSRMTVSQLVDVCRALQLAPVHFFEGIDFPEGSHPIDRDTASLVRAFGALRDRRQRACVVDLLRSMAPPGGRPGAA